MVSVTDAATRQRGSSVIIVCHDIVMMFWRTLPAVAGSTSGPGSSKPHTFDRVRDSLAVSGPLSGRNAG